MIFPSQLNCAAICSMLKIEYNRIIHFLQISVKKAVFSNGKKTSGITACFFLINNRSNHHQYKGYPQPKMDRSNNH